ncbi:hypothetical protein KVE59_01035 [Helicobacter pylori]|nr:hypothetical protein KVE59_01035 [Helicobacter pylori]
MWNEKFLRVIPAAIFLFCILEIFELVLIVKDMNDTEKLETEIRNNLKELEYTTILLKEYLECKQLKHFEDKKIKIK